LDGGINMFKLGEAVVHTTYGKGEIISFDTQDKSRILVAFEEEHEVFIRDITDEEYHFEDNSRLEKTKFIEVYTWDLNKIDNLGTDFKNSQGIKMNEHYINHCHSCGKMVSSQTHSRCEVCGWYKCECGSCECNYKGKIR
jgi:hypothetical protein